MWQSVSTPVTERGRQFRPVGRRESEWRERVRERFGRGSDRRRSFELYIESVDGSNFQFMNDPELLAAWDSASSVLAAPKTTPKPDPAPPTGGEIRPAA